MDAVDKDPGRMTALRTVIQAGGLGDRRHKLDIHVFQLVQCLRFTTQIFPSYPIPSFVQFIDPGAFGAFVSSSTDPGAGALPGH